MAPELKCALMRGQVPSARRQGWGEGASCVPRSPSASERSKAAKAHQQAAVSPRMKMPTQMITRLMPTERQTVRKTK